MANLSAVIKDYLARHSDDAENELRLFEIQSSFKRALYFAAHAKTPAGKRFSHQRRIPHSVLEEVFQRLDSCIRVLQDSSTFEELHQVIRECIHGVHGVGPLLVYDTAIRLGANLGLKPSVVFLHAGTRVGAKRLGLNTSRPFIPIPEFPSVLQKLSASQIEDILCIYKDELIPSENRISHALGCSMRSQLPAPRRKCSS